MMLEPIVLSNYMNKFLPIQQKKKKKNQRKRQKRKKKNSARDPSTWLETLFYLRLLLLQHTATCELLFNQFLTNSGFHLNKIFPIFLSHFHLSRRPIPSLSFSLTKKNKKKKKTFPHFLSLQSPILQFPRRSRVSPPNCIWISKFNSLFCLSRILRRVSPDSAILGWEREKRLNDDEHGDRDRRGVVRRRPLAALRGFSFGTQIQSGLHREALRAMAFASWFYSSGIICFREFEPWLLCSFLLIWEFTSMVFDICCLSTKRKERNVGMDINWEVIYAFICARVIMCF